jgi:enolase
VIDHIEAHEIFLNEFVRTVEIVIFCTFSGKVQALATHTLSFSNRTGFNMDPENDGMQNAAGVIQTSVSKAMQNRSLPNSKTIDEALIQLRGEHPELNLGDNIVSVVSYGISKAVAKGKNLPLYKCKTRIKLIRE